MKPETLARMKRGLAQNLLRAPANRTETDFAAVCISARGDTWMLFPISKVGEDGRVLEIHHQAFGALDLKSVNQAPAICTFGGRYFDLDQIYALCWRPFEGFAPLEAAVRAIKRDAP